MYRSQAKKAEAMEDDEIRIRIATYMANGKLDDELAFIAGEEVDINGRMDDILTLMLDSLERAQEGEL